MKTRNEREDTRAAKDMKIDGKRRRVRPKMRRQDTMRKDLKAWKVKEELTGRNGRYLAKPATSRREKTGKGEKWDINIQEGLLNVDSHVEFA